MTNKAKELVAGSRSYEMRFVMLPRFDMATLATMIEPSQYRLAWPESETAPSWPGTMYALTHAAKAYRAEK